MIELYGWTVPLQIAFAPLAAQGLFPARVTAHHRGLWRLVTPKGDMTGRLSGRFALDAGPGEHPVVGDWLGVTQGEGAGDAMIHALLPRKTSFTRRAAGGSGAQVVAANVDVAFLVAALNNDLNLRRIERYLVATRDSGAAPVIVLTKADLSTAPEQEIESVKRISRRSAGRRYLRTHWRRYWRLERLARRRRDRRLAGQFRRREVHAAQRVGGTGAHGHRRRP